MPTTEKKPILYPVSVIAKLFDITHRRVQQLAKEGVIPKAERGKYDLVACVTAYIKYLRESIEKQGSGESLSAIKTERARYYNAQAQMAELELKKRTEALVDIESVGQILNEVMVIVSTQLEGLGGRLAGELAGMKDPALIRHKLLEETRSIRTSAADRLALIGSIKDSGRNTKATTNKKPRSVGKRKKSTTTRKRRTRTMEK